MCWQFLVLVYCRPGDSDSHSLAYRKICWQRLTVPFAATHQRILESEDQLRRLAFELSIDHFRYGAVGQEEPYDSDPEW